MLTSAAFRVLVCALATALATCHAPPRARSPRAEQTPEPAPAGEAAESADAPGADEPRGPRRFDPDVVRPAADSAVGRVRAALEADDAERAAALAAQALAHGREDELHRLWWLSARASREAGHPSRAFATLANTADSEHPLAPWARLDRARILMEADASAAADEVAALTERAWAGRSEARDLHAAALVEAGRTEEAEPLLRALLEEAPEGSARASVAMPLADLLAARDDVEAQVEALGLYRRVATRAPLSSEAEAAEERIGTLLRALPLAHRRTLGRPTPAQAFERAQALAGAMRFADAEEAFAEVAERTDDEALRCRARYGEGRAVYYRRQRRRAAELLSAVARDCEAPEVRAWARYLAGKGYFSADEPERSLEQYARLEAEVPEHSLADDARYRAALVALEGDDEAAAIERLASLPETYPDGDMRGRARFMLAWRARRSGDLGEALSHLEATIAEGPLEDREDLPGRAAYWRGVVLTELDREAEGRRALAGVVRDAPLTYYAQQALVRLGELDEAAAREARDGLGRPEPTRLTFAWRDELDDPAFARALELLRVGEAEKAERELEWIRSQSEADDDELRWIEAALLDRAGAHSRAVYVTRRHLNDFMDRPPTGDHWARWRIAYPRAFAEEVVAAVQGRPVPPELVFAVAREESSFRPHAMSVAHAYGLTQVILPTARRFGRRIDIRATRRNLLEPATNLAIGAEYMGWLWERYESNPVVLPSAYNAGQGATDRWLRERPDQRLDEWIEEIPYDETRRYTRRVLQTWGIYTWLDRGELPPLRAELPSR
ncbi:MAG TPA: transglycosylase SLT domain-containing protein [Sandaracinaceae bacterium LLY-WYZ-13_1]|nr:transglycosylase SLT domain-containing protein [Sandaracinaceae bacterium LLY-WYZ-13_1]